jgi:hypothetical protein
LLLLISNTRYSRDHTGLYKQAMMERRGGDDQVERIRKLSGSRLLPQMLIDLVALTAPAKKARVGGADRK